MTQVDDEELIRSGVLSSLLPTLGGDSFCVRMAFRVLDKKGLGFIQSSSFKHLMTNIGASYLHHHL